MKILGSLLTIFGCLSVISLTDASVSLNINGLAATVKNEHAELFFNADGSLSTCLIMGKNIAVKGQKTFYLDWNSNSGYGQFKPNSIHVVEQTKDRAHFYWLQKNNDNIFTIELHYIMVSGLTGIYSYAKYRNDKKTNLVAGETRIVYRFAGDILTQGTSGQRVGTTPTSAELNKGKSVQDSTWQLPNGTYYSKYDFAAYIRETHHQGVYGHGFGAFVISPSREYHGGGPMKQDLTVHQECLVANYFMSGHLSGTNNINAAPGWKKFFGPFLIYFPVGSNRQIENSVQKQIEIEKGQWPYSWVKDNDYPLKRGRLSGVVSGQKHAVVVAWDSTNEEFDVQGNGYLYHAETDSKGYYLIDNIRPGSYKVAAYPLSGLGSENQPTTTVTIGAGSREHAAFDLPEPQNIIWSLGEVNRRSSEFRYADQPRNYQWMSKPPAELTFTIGKSNPATDWYYAQSKPGHWFIKYQDKNDGRPRTLRIALAAASQKTHFLVSVNGQRVHDDYFQNDQAIYRSAMQSGKFHSLVYTVQPQHVVNGENTLDLWISLGQLMYDAISLQRS